jgi:NAD(P)-dependent dehydrogenase (short-subunit alcohol dehydrogenase family)
MDLGIQGKSVLVTGGSKGIGLASAKSFAAEGCNVHIASRSAAALETARQEIEKDTGHRATLHSVDVSIEQQRQELAPLLQDIDILVNCAGAIPGGGFDEISLNRWQQAWELKVYGYIEMTRMALAAMKEHGSGVIVNVIGAAGADPKYSYLCGSVANAALITFTKAVGAYSAQIGVAKTAKATASPSGAAAAAGQNAMASGIRVVGLNPGPTSTERLISLYRGRAQSQLGDPERWQELLSDLPFGRPAAATEIADIVTFLASKRASYLTGVVIDADGGAMYR